MEQAAREARNAYMREYRKSHKEQIYKSVKKYRDKNKEKIKEINERYWLKKSQEQQE